MAITNMTQQRIGNATTVTVTSDLSGTIYYHWYIDGALIASTTAETYSFFLEAGEHVRIEVIDTNDADFDPIAGAPAGYPGRRTLRWIRPFASGIASYRIEQKKGAGSWVTIGTQINEPMQWSYFFLTPRLDDLANYTWRITPLNDAGDDATALTIGPEMIVRTPDAPDFTITFDAGTTKVTFAAAA